MKFSRIFRRGKKSRFEGKEQRKKPPLCPTCRAGCQGGKRQGWLDSTGR